MILYPVPGRKVRDPITKQVLTASKEVGDRDPNLLWWLRRLGDGDVTDVAPEPVPEAATAADTPAA